LLVKNSCFGLGNFENKAETQVQLGVVDMEVIVVLAVSSREQVPIGDFDSASVLNRPCSLATCHSAHFQSLILYSLDNYLIAFSKTLFLFHLIYPGVFPLFAPRPLAIFMKQTSGCE
jgi:hypothetical protein